VLSIGVVTNYGFWLGYVVMGEKGEIRMSYSIEDEEEHEDEND
jgi:hypothetical protein